MKAIMKMILIMLYYTDKNNHNDDIDNDNNSNDNDAIGKREEQYFIEGPTSYKWNNSYRQLSMFIFLLFCFERSRLQIRQNITGWKLFATFTRTPEHTDYLKIYIHMV